MSLGLGQNDVFFRKDSSDAQRVQVEARVQAQSRLRAGTVLHLLAARSVMNQLACDVNLSEQAEL